MLIRIFSAIIIFCTVLIAANANGQSSTVVTKTSGLNLENGLAIQGYDPVTYFTLGKAVKGNSSISVNRNGVTYYFSSGSNRELFNQNPSKYEPAYGGWCAYAMGVDGSKVEIDPETFKIVDGHLCLFYNFYFTNTLPKWNKQESQLKKNADANWNKLNNNH